MKDLVIKKSKRQEVQDEISQKLEEMKDMTPGSPEYLDATKSINQLAEASQKLKVDLLPWVTLVANIGLSVVLIAAGQKEIIDTRPVTFVKGLFKR